MKPYTLKWWLRKQNDCIVGAEFSWKKYRETKQIKYRKRFLELWTTAHWITDRIITKYGEQND